jgi:plastocyanin
MRPSTGVPRVLLTAGLMMLGPFACAAQVAVQIFDAAGRPVADAAVYAEPASGQLPLKPAKKVDIEQKSRQFLPPVTVIQVGTEVLFPNNDTVRHHVYSFSPPKVFELKLYAGVPANAVTFDKPGTVVLGCNIHDQMVAYVHVVPTPYFGKTDATGRAALDGLAPGQYRLKAWHFGLPPGAQVVEQSINVTANGAATTFRLALNGAPAAK